MICGVSLQEERRTEWAAAIPIGFLTFLLGVFLWPVVALAAVAALLTLLVRACSGRPRTPLTYVCLGTIAGTLLLALFLTITALTGGVR